MTSYAIVATIVAAYLIYKVYILTKTLKSIKPVSVEIGSIDVFTSDDEEQLS
jgi:hypothetical protein